MTIKKYLKVVQVGPILPHYLLSSVSLSEQESLGTASVCLDETGLVWRPVHSTSGARCCRKPAEPHSHLEQTLRHRLFLVVPATTPNRPGRLALPCDRLHQSRRLRPFCHTGIDQFVAREFPLSEKGRGRSEGGQLIYRHVYTSVSHLGLKSMARIIQIMQDALYCEPGNRGLA